MAPTHALTHVNGEYRFEETTSISEQANLVQLGRVGFNERTKIERRTTERNETRKHERPRHKLTSRAPPKIIKIHRLYPTLSFNYLLYRSLQVPALFPLCPAHALPYTLQTHYVIHPNKLHSLPHVPLFSAGPLAKTLLGKLERQSSRNRILFPFFPFSSLPP